MCLCVSKNVFGDPSVEKGIFAKKRLVFRLLSH